MVRQIVLKHFFTDKRKKKTLLKIWQICKFCDGMYRKGHKKNPLAFHGSEVDKKIPQ